jgi:hypothetical protein
MNTVMNPGFTKGGEFLEKVSDSMLLIKGRGCCSTPNFLNVDKNCTFKSLVETVSPLSLCLSVWKVTETLAYIVKPAYPSTPSSADGALIS